MSGADTFPKRKWVRCRTVDYSAPGGYFVTVCTHLKRCIFGKVIDGVVHLNSFGSIVREEWLRSAELRRNVRLDEFIVMPNHMHGIVVITERLSGGEGIGVQEAHREGDNARTCRRHVPTGPGKGELGSIVGHFKGEVTERIRRVRPGYKVWQPGYFDHVIRNNDDWENIRAYIRTNPQRWRGCES